MRVLNFEESAALLRDDHALTAPLDALLRPMLEAPQTLSFTQRIAYASLRLWLAEDSNMRVDKMSMFMSIESRAPLEDHHLVELALSLPLPYKLRGGMFKRVMKDALRGIVPNFVLNRPKWGFIPPMSDWLRGCLRPLMMRYLSREYVEAVGVFRADAVMDLVTRHLDQREYHLKPLWTLLVFHLWHALYIDGSLRLGQRLRPDDLVNRANTR